MRWWIAFDFGQLEARCICMEVGDKDFIEKLTGGEADVHKDWSRRIIKYHPPVIGIKPADFKTFEQVDDVILAKYRNIVKSGFVFPLFFGSSEHSVGKTLGLPKNITKKLYNEFWNEFDCVKKWQKRLEKSCKEKGYVEGIHGTRRHLPLSRPKLINAPIQSLGAFITINAMNRLAHLARKINEESLHLRINIHDDLTFSVPDHLAEWAIPIIAKEMCRHTFDWMKGVPLLVDVEIGKTWGSLESVASFTTNDFDYTEKELYEVPRFTH